MKVKIEGMVRKISLDRISSTLGHSSANMDLLYETRVLLCTTWLAFVGVVAWLISIATDYWVIIIGELTTVCFTDLGKLNLPMVVQFYTQASFQYCPSYL
jgi:hypothetical protein